MKYILALVAALTLFAFGRFSAPDKVVVQTKIVEVEKKTEKTDAERDKHKETQTTTVTNKDGTTTTTTKTVEDSKTEKKTASTDTTQIDESVTKTTSKEQKVTILLLAGTNLSNPLGVDYGVSLTKPVLGPITIGVFGFKSQLVGASVGLTF